MTTSKRLSPRAVGDAAVALLAAQRARGWPGDLIAWGDCYTLDEIADHSGFDALHPLHPLDRHRRILDALDRDPRFEKFFFRCVDSGGVRERLVRAFRLRTTDERTSEDSKSHDTSSG